MNTKKTITEYDGLDLELFFCTEVLKLNSLHYGFWNSDEELILPNLKKAQERYTTTLIKLIPKGVKTILDVGCGIGDVSGALVKKGYCVTAISPDKNHSRYFNKKIGNLKFIKTKLENFESDEKFDLILMCESQNYFHTNIGFMKCKQLLKPSGYLLVSGMFRKTNDKNPEEITNIKGEYLSTANEYGFKLIKQIDITKKILPNLVFVQKGLQEYVMPTSKMIEHFFYSTSPLKTRFLKFLFQKQLNGARKIFDYYKERTNPKYFTEKVEYSRLLFHRIK